MMAGEVRMLPPALASWLHWRRWDVRMPIWYDPEYRLPLTAFGKRTGLDPRRADLVVWYLLEWRWVTPRNLRSPARARYDELARVHAEGYLESLARQDTLAQIFGVDPWDVPVDELMRTVRLGAGGTLAAARESLARRGPTVNLLGGFHHAFPDRGSGLCAVNDMAVAIATLRHEGFEGQVVVLDLDAHPPDGTAACLRGDAHAWIGSLSGATAGGVEGADETVLPPGCDDATYLAALGAVLDRMPRPALAMVVAGGDVLAGDSLGQLGLTLDGARRRDLLVADRLRGVPTVWLPGGGYHADAWKVLAGTVVALLRHSRQPVRPGRDPMEAWFARLARQLDAQRRPRPADLTLADIEDDLGIGRDHPRLLFGTLSAESIEYALYRFGIVAFLERRGYSQCRVALSAAASGGERVSVYGRGEDGAEHLLVDCVLQRRELAGAEVLYIHWLALRDPRARFSASRPRLPGQDVPGLGLAREITGLLRLLAERTGLAGVAFTPAWYHTAYVARERFRFLDPARQGRFEAMVRDCAGLPLAEVSQAVAEGRVHLNGHPYRWEADDMVWWLVPRAGDDQAGVDDARRHAQFTVLPPDAPERAVAAFP
jgi:acetoin utilization deacetylase AcuC-like enzyme